MEMLDKYPNYNQLTYGRFVGG